MSSARLSILVWRDAAGLFGAAPATAALAEARTDGAMVGHGRDESSAVGELISLLSTAEREHSLRYQELEGSRLKIMTISLRSAQIEQGKRYVARQPVRVPIVCVHGHDSSGVHIAVLPFLGVELRFHDRASLVALVEHAARERLEGMTPEELAAGLPPVWLAIRELNLPRAGDGDRSAASRETPTLSLVAEPLGQGRRGGRAWERDEVVRVLVDGVALRRGSVLVVGEAGCGKTQVITDALARLGRETRAKGGAAHPWHGRSAWLTSAARIMAGMRYLGDWQDRCEQLVAELRQIDGVLVLEDLLEFFRGGQSIGAFLLPLVSRQQIQIVAECTPGELVACRRLAPALLEEVTILTLEPCDRATSLAILQRVAEAERRHLGAEVDPLLATTLLELCERFAPHRSLPGLPVEMLRQLCEEVRRDAGGASAVGGGGASGGVSPAAAIDVFVRRSGLPRSLLDDSIVLLADEVADGLGSEVLGQPQACRAVASAVITFKAGLCDPSRPIAVLLFCGPTGVGKTALARALASYLFGGGAVDAQNQDRLVRIDMSEYSTPVTARTFLQGHDGSPGVLIRRIRAQPFSLVLLDEIDKAAPEALQPLLTILGAGRSTDDLGHTTSFQSALFVLTANLGGDQDEPAGFGHAPTVPPVNDEIEAHLGAELTNNIDAVVQFQTIDRTTAGEILGKEIDQISTREGLQSRDLKLACTPRMLDHLITAGFDPRYGARPLQRSLEQELVAPLARFLLDKPDLEDTTIQIDRDDQGDTKIEIR